MANAKMLGSNMPDSAAKQLKPSGKNHAENGFGGASSDVGGQRTRAALSVNNDDEDTELQRVMKQGAKKKKSEEDDDAEITGGK